MKISSIVLVSIHIVIVQVFLRKLYCYSIMRVASISFLGETISQKTSWSSDSYYLSTLYSEIFPEVFASESDSKPSINLCLMTSFGFLNLSLLLRDTSLMRAVRVPLICVPVLRVNFRMQLGIVLS